MKKNNLFDYATSELSQDAFFCWLLTFAHPDHLFEEPALMECAKEVLSKFVTTDEELIVTDIKRQYKNIDILVQINDKYSVIIEDKTFSGQHDNQINKYKECLSKEGRQDIICVYLKIIEQCHAENNVININRQDLLEIFSKYITKTQNKIFLDFYDHLLFLDKCVNSYQTLPIQAWDGDYNHAYKGFFTHLIRDHIITVDDNVGWDYVANPSGGFWGLWWHWLKGSDLAVCNFNENLLEALYLQIENNLIAVKMIGGAECTNDVRWSLYKHFTHEVSGFRKKAFRSGKWLTIGFVEYNETNYKEKIKLMEKSMQSIVSGDYRFDR